MCNWPENDWQLETGFKKINSTCSQGIYCVWWSEVETLSPVFRLSSHLSWPLKFLYWCWVINSHQRDIFLLILSSRALMRAKPGTQACFWNSGTGSWEWYLKMEGYLLSVSSLPLPIISQSETLKLFLFIWCFYVPRKQRLFKPLSLWSHRT